MWNNFSFKCFPFYFLYFFFSIKRKGFLGNPISAPDYYEDRNKLPSSSINVNGSLNIDISNKSITIRATNYSKITLTATTLGIAQIANGFFCEINIHGPIGILIYTSDHKIKAFADVSKKTLPCIEAYKKLESISYIFPKNGEPFESLVYFGIYPEFNVEPINSGFFFTPKNNSFLKFWGYDLQIIDTRPTNYHFLSYVGQEESNILVIFGLSILIVTIIIVILFLLAFYIPSLFFLRKILIFCKIISEESEEKSSPDEPTNKVDTI